MRGGPQLVPLYRLEPAVAVTVPRTPTIPSGQTPLIPGATWAGALLLGQWANSSNLIAMPWKLH